VTADNLPSGPNLQDAVETGNGRVSHKVRSTLERLRAERMALKSDRDRLDADNHLVVSSLSEARVRITDLEQANTRQQDENEVLNRRLSQVTTEYSEMEFDLQQLLSRSKETIAELQAELERVTAELEDKSAELAEIEDFLDQPRDRE